MEVAEGGPGFNYFSKEKHEKSATTLSIMFSSLPFFFVENREEITSRT